MNLRKVFGQNIRRLREKQNLTQSDLALKANINRSYLGGVERGQRNICIENIVKIAEALGVSADILFKATDKSE